MSHSGRNSKKLVFTELAVADINSQWQEMCLRLNLKCYWPLKLTELKHFFIYVCYF